MSLLDKASLIVTPNAYNSGTLYSVIPSDGSGDMTFSRASTGTRVNSQGLVEVVPYNLFTYTEDLTNGVWSVANGSITSNSTTAPNGTSTADTYTANGTLSNHDFFQGVTTGSTPTASIYVKKNTAQYVYISLNYQGSGVNWATGIYDLDNLITATFQSGGVTNQVAAITDAGNGWRRISLSVSTANNDLFCMVGVSDSMSPTLSARGRVENSSTASFYAWGAQLNEGSLKDYFPIGSTRNNFPRLDHSNGSCPSLLLEPQRTNLLPQSAAFDASPWVAIGTTITANTQVSPSGELTADTFSTAQGNLLYQTISASTSTTYTLSLYVKLGTATNICLVVNNTAAWNTIGGESFDSSDGLNTSTWTRISFTFTTPSSLPAGAINVHIGGNAETGLTQSTGTVYLWGAQLEAGSYATSYIPTTSASVTRVADVCSKTGISSLIGQTEGTVYAEFYNYGNNSTTTGCPISIASGGFYGNAIYIEQYLGNYYAVIWNGLTQQFISSPLSLSVGFHKVAIAYKTNDIAFYADGNLIATDTSATIPTCNGVFLGTVGTSTGVEQIEVKAGILFKERLSNAELAQLTTI